MNVAFYIWLHTFGFSNIYENLVLIANTARRIHEFSVRLYLGKRGVGKGKEPTDSLRVVSWNLGTLSGKLLEVVDICLFTVVLAIVRKG